MTEQEQLQEIKTWIKQYGPTVLAGILIAFGITSAWHAWQNYQTKKLVHASGVFDEMLELRAQNNLDGATVQANKLVSDYANTPYAQMAAFNLARTATLNKNYAEANRQLAWVMDHSKEHSIQQIARIRSARVLLTQNKPDAALTLLAQVDDKAFIGLIDEIRGDAYLLQKDTVSAQKAYKLALTEIPNAEINRPILQMKYNNLATENTQIS